MAWDISRVRHSSQLYADHGDARRDRAPGRRARNCARAVKMVNLKSGAKDPAGKFQVFMDEVELLRPISFQFLQGKKQVVARPMLFVGSYKPDLSKVSADVRGGDLDFEAAPPRSALL